MSDSASSSRSSSPAPALDPATLAILNSFLSDKAAEEDRFKALQQQQRDAAETNGPERMISVDDFRATFGENFGASQFWYSTPFAYSLARSLRDLCPSSSTRVCFISSPTAYVAFQSLSSSSVAHEGEEPLTRTVLFEYDDRFAALPVVGRERRATAEEGGEGEETGPEEPSNKERGGFQIYDLYDPERFDERLRGTVDLAVIDPPYLNEKTNLLVARTLALLLAPQAKLLVLTSTSVPLEVLQKAYALPQLGELRRCEGVKIEHEGGRIQNDFGMWASWEGGENFMASQIQP